MQRIRAENYATHSALAKEVANYLTVKGGVVVSNLFCEVSEQAEIEEQLYALCNLIGDVSSHDENDTPIWDIKANANRSEYNTFSEHANEAELHTDSQYRNNPEDHFALYCITQATCGGGLSLFISVDDILSDLEELDNGSEIIRSLRNDKFPFIVPDIFKEKVDGPPEFTFGHILDGNKIRFRIDSIERAIALDSSLMSPSANVAFTAIKSIALRSPRIGTDCLESKDCLFINNKTMLHGRTKFSDVNRHLLRIRFNDKAQ